MLINAIRTTNRMIAMCQRFGDDDSYWKLELDFLRETAKHRILHSGPGTEDRAFAEYCFLLAGGVLHDRTLIGTQMAFYDYVAHRMRRQ